MDMRTEPSVIVGTITGAAAAVIAVLVAFGVPITDDQRTALLGLVAVLAPVIAAVIIRGKVYAPETVQRLVREAHPSPARTSVPRERWGVEQLRREREDVA